MVPKRAEEIRQEIAGARPESSTGERSAPFALLREVRAAARVVRQLDGIWTQWSPATCRQALNEFGPLRQMITELVRRAGD